MTAYYVIATPALGAQGDVFGVVADDSTAHYVFSDGSSGLMGLDDARVAMAVHELGETPTQAFDWLALALTNIGYFNTTAPTEAPTIEAATTAVQQQIAVAPPQDEGTANAPNPPQTRDELMAWQREMMDQWAQEFPEAASGEVSDPEADLALRQYLTPPTDPTKTHAWLPLSIHDVNCGFCDKPANDAIHNADADTITSGSN